MAKGKKKTHEQFIQEMNKVNPNIEILGTYTNGKTKILCRCRLCKCEWKTVPADLLRHHGCPKCRSNAPKSHEKFVEEMKIVNPNIQILGKYIWNKSNIECKCKICLYEWKPMPSDLLKGHGCPKCSKNATRTHEEFVNEMKNINPNLKILGRYINTRMKIDYECMICGKKNSARASKLLEGCGCPNCIVKSKMEVYINNYLNSNNITFDTQKKYSGLVGVGGKLLSYDFYLPDYNLLIECQGRQHKMPIEYFGGEKTYKIQKEHDKRKRNYAKDHNMRLLEIWYYDFNKIKNILNKYLKEAA